MDVLGVRVDNLARSAVERHVLGYLDTPGFHRVATVNPEFLVRADDDVRFRDNLNRSDLSVADGSGLCLAAWRAGERLRCRYPGADLVRFVCGEAERRGLSVFLAMRRNGLSTFEETRDRLRSSYPTLTVGGADSFDGASSAGELVAAASGYHAVLCSFGAPEQEYFVESLRGQSGSVRLAIGVGGSLDYLTGRQRRAPRWMRAGGLEWLWRLVTRPARWRRIARAVIVFPCRLVKSNNKA